MKAMNRDCFRIKFLITLLYSYTLSQRTSKGCVGYLKVTNVELTSSNTLLTRAFEAEALLALFLVKEQQGKKRVVRLL
jgi:hypothetical protein